MGITGESQISADGMIVIAMVDRSDNGILIGQLGQPGQMLGDGDSRHARSSRFELAANFARGIRFQIPNIEVRRPAVIEDDDTGLGFSKLSLEGFASDGLWLNCAPGAEQIGPHQPGETQTTDSQSLSA